MGESYTLNYINDKRVSFPNGLEYANYIEIIISEGFTEVPDRCFQKFSNLRNITFPTSLLSIGDEILTNTKVEYLKIPKNVNYLYGGNPFDSCYTLSHIDVDPLNQYYCSVDGIVYKKDLKYLFHFPASKKVTYFIVPNGVEVLGHACFYNHQYLKYITVPESVTYISNSAFAASNLFEKIVVIRYFNQKIPNINHNMLLWILNLKKLTSFIFIQIINVLLILQKSIHLFKLFFLLSSFLLMTKN